MGAIYGQGKIMYSISNYSQSTGFPCFFSLLITNEYFSDSY